MLTFMLCVIIVLLSAAVLGIWLCASGINRISMRCDWILSYIQRIEDFSSSGGITRETTGVLRQIEEDFMKLLARVQARWPGPYD